MARNPLGDSARGVTGVVQELVESFGRFSIAMGIAGARQALGFISDAGSGAARSLDKRLTRAASQTRAVGANLRSGLDAALVELVGAGPPDPPRNDDATPLGMPIATAASRRVAGMQRIGKGARLQVRQARFISRLADNHRQASDTHAPVDRVVAHLWKSEGLAGSMGRHLLPENSLNDPALPRKVLPVVHVGFGSGSAEALAFDAVRLRERFDARCANEYVGFAYEGVGATLRFYERGLFKLASGALDFIALDAQDGPDPAGFFAAYMASFPADVQRLIAHGYGRIITFSTLSIYSAIDQAIALPADRIEPAVHGVAFACAMVNSRELPRVLQQSAVPYQPSVRAAFQNGLIYALAFLEWYVPGILARWKPHEGLEAGLIEHAKREAELSRGRGFPLAFRLAEPRVARRGSEWTGAAAGAAAIAG